MVSVLVIYYSRTGNTEQMAKSVAEGAREAGAEVKLASVENTEPELMLDHDAIIVGSPTYYGVVAGPIKEYFDESVRFHGQLEGKVGGAFSSAGSFGGGSEITIMSLLQILLVHGMVIKGFSSGSHFGPVAAGAPDEDTQKECRNLGREVVNLAES